MEKEQNIEELEKAIEEIEEETPNAEEEPRHASPEPLIPDEPKTTPEPEQTPTPKEELNEPNNLESEKKEKVEKKKVNPIALAILILLLLAIACFAVWYGVAHKNKDSNSNENGVARSFRGSSVNPPEDIELVDINTINNGNGGELYLDCTFRDTLDYVRNKTVKPGDKIQCSYGVEVENKLKVDTIYLQLDYGEGLKLTSTSNIKASENVLEENKLRTNVKIPSPVVEEAFTYYFEVTEDASTKNLTIDVTNIVIRTTSNNYYKLDDVKINFTRNSNKYYVYKSKNDDGKDEVYVLDREDTQTKNKLYGTYECQTDDCEYLYDESGNYILFDDGGYKAYNYERNKIEDLSKFNKYSDIDLVAKDKLIGLILYEEGEELDRTGYYSLEKNKFIIPLKTNYYVVATDNYIYSFGDDRPSQIIDFQGNKYKPTKKDLVRFGKTDFYILELDEFFEFRILLYDKEGNPKLGGSEFSNLTYSFAESSNHNLLIVEDNNFVEIDVNEKEIYRSDYYEEIILLDNCIGVVDENENLKVIDEREKVVVDFGTIPDDYYIDSAYSEDYESNGKYEVQIVIRTETISDKEMKEAIKENYPLSDGYTEEDWEDFLDYDRGYEYYYDMSTGEKGRTIIPIGGHD